GRNQLASQRNAANKQAGHLLRQANPETIPPDQWSDVPGALPTVPLPSMRASPRGLTQVACLSPRERAMVGQDCCTPDPLERKETCVIGGWVWSKEKSWVAVSPHPLSRNVLRRACVKGIGGNVESSLAFPANSQSISATVSRFSGRPSRANATG